MNILYIAYSCMPEKGSEEKIGWSIPLESAKTNKVFVVTKKEHRKTIEQYIHKNAINNIKFYYVDIPKAYKCVFKGIAYSLRLNIWLKKATTVVREICKEEKIDIIHQITPVEFRSVGDFYKIQDIPFICGPLGGGETIPEGLKVYAKGNIFIEYVRHLLNRWYRLFYKYNKKFQHCDYVFFANEETKEFLGDLVEDTRCSILSDTGISKTDIEPESRIHSKKETIIFLVAGRLVYRKGHEFLFDALAQLPQNINYQCRVVGNGPKADCLKQLVKKNNLGDKVVFTGKISFAGMTDEYKNADVFIMPSVRETTGSVILEATTKGLPVIAINHFGGKVLLDNETAWLLNGKTKEEYIEAIKQAIISCCSESSEIFRKGENARKKSMQHTWEKKLEIYNSVYKEIVK